MQKDMSNLQKETLAAKDAECSAANWEAEGTELEIDLVSLVYRLLERAKYIAAAAIIGAMLAGVVAVFFTTPQYTATAKLYVMNSGDSAINLSDLQIGTYLTADYTEVFKNWHVHEMVIQELNLPYSYRELSQKLKVSNPSNTRILYLSVTTANPQEAKLIADTYAAKAQEFIASIMDTRMPNLFEEALTPSVPSSRGVKANMVIGFAIGLLLACALFTIEFIVDDRIFNSEDIEKYLGMNVLGIMPVIAGRSGAARKADRKER